MFLNCGAEKTRERTLDSKEIKPVNLKGNQSWISIGRPDAEAEASILCPPDTKSLLIGKGHDSGKDWRQKEERVTADEMVEWDHRCNKHELGQSLVDGVGVRDACWAAVYWIMKNLSWLDDWTATML